MRALLLVLALGLGGCSCALQSVNLAAGLVVGVTSGDPMPAAIAAVGLLACAPMCRLRP